MSPVAIVAPAVLWLVRLPLCAVARVDQVNEGAEACQVALSRSVAMTDLQLVGLVARAPAVDRNVEAVGGQNHNSLVADIGHWDLRTLGIGRGTREPAKGSEAKSRTQTRI